MILGTKLTAELDVLLWSNDGDTALNKHLAQHLVDIGDHKRINELQRSESRSEYLSDLTGRDVEIKPRSTDYSAYRENAKLTKYLNAFWNESCYSHELLRNIFSRVTRCINQRGVELPMGDILEICEDIIPHILSLELVETYAYTSVVKALDRNELLVEQYHCGEIDKAECRRLLSKNTEYPVLDTVDDFLNILFKECYNYRYLMPRASKNGKPIAYSIARQYRQGIGHQVALGDDLIEWMEDGEIFDAVNHVEPITVDTIKLLLAGNDLALYAIDHLLQRDADVNRLYLSNSDIQLALNVTDYTARSVITDLREAAKTAQANL